MYYGFTITESKEFIVAERFDHKIIVATGVLDKRFSMIKYIKKKIKKFVLSSY